MEASGSGRRRDRDHFKRMSHNQGKRIPDRWLNYDPVGRDLKDTRFVPFKTPLDRSFFSGKSLDPRLHFEVQDLLYKAKSAGERIGLVVDLTNTDRYYRKSEWNENDVEYRKINCPGHTVNTREDIVQEFNSIINEFFSNKENDGKLVGVHCTHGLNRTGYLICRYLIDERGFTAGDSISLFEYSRGHPIERSEYKKSLYEAEIRRKNRISQENQVGSQENQDGKLDGIQQDQIIPAQDIQEVGGQEDQDPSPQVVQEVESQEVQLPVQA